MKKIKISELPLYQSLVGLFTIGTDAQNRSVKVSLEFIETSTQQAVTNAQNATSAAVAATEQAQAAKQAATEAAAAAQDAATLAGQKAQTAEDKATLAFNAAQAANNAKTAADAATEAANAAKQAADQAAADAIDAKQATNNATAAAEAATAEVLLTIGTLVPTALTVIAPTRLTFGNVMHPQIVATLAPVTAMKNIIFLSDNNSVRVAPDGKITIVAVGQSIIHVIPTLNCALAKTILIEVMNPAMRFTQNNRMRILASGGIRLK